MVLIGDKALMADARAEEKDLFSYDLSQVWQHHTGLPFVFALWILRRDSAERNANRLAAFWQTIHQVHHDIEDPDDEMVRDVLERKPFMTEDSLRAYWDTIAYRLDDSHIEGLLLFYTLAVEAGLLQSVPDFEVFHPEHHCSPA